MHSEVKICDLTLVIITLVIVLMTTEVHSPGNVFLWTSCEKMAHILNVTKRRRFPLCLSQEQSILKTGNAAH